MKFNWQTVAIIALLLVIFFLILRSCNQETKVAGYVAIQRVLEDSLHTEINKSGQQTAHILSLQTSVKELKQIHTHDSLLLRIQKNVTPTTTAAVSFDDITHRKDSAVTEIRFPNIIPISDTPCDTIWPEYESTVIGPWDTIHVWSSRNKTTVEYVILNEHDIRQYFQKTGFLGLRKEPVLEIVELNPNARVIGARSFQVETKKPKVLLWMAVGAALFEGFKAVVLK